MFIETRPNILLSSVGATYKTGHISPLRGSKWVTLSAINIPPLRGYTHPKNKIKFLKLTPTPKYILTTTFISATMTAGSYCNQI